MRKTACCMHLFNNVILAANHRALALQRQSGLAG